ncbi:MAG: hypothetical protein IJL03_11350 [Lachnospiraceae bacterium]|nr:hypothetical protein [Lachnospiraceae bacterium]
MKTRRGYMVIAVFMGLLTVMTGVCFADVANPGGLLFLLPFMLALYIYVITSVVTFIVLLVGLCLLLWRLIHPKAQRTHKFSEHVDVIISLLGGLILSGIIVGLVTYVKALKKGAQIFLDDVRGKDVESPKWGEFVCVVFWIVASVAVWIPIRGSFEDGNLFTHLFGWDLAGILRNTGCRTPDWTLYLACITILAWVVMLIGDHIIFRKEPERLKKRMPDELTVLGLLLLGYWWYLCGALFYYMALLIANGTLWGQPVQIEEKAETSSPETEAALRKMRLLDGEIKKDGLSEDE